jgi:hypothetical protein
MQSLASRLRLARSARRLAPSIFVCFYLETRIEQHQHTPPLRFWPFLSRNWRRIAARMPGARRHSQRARSVVSLRPSVVSGLSVWTSALSAVCNSVPRPDADQRAQQRARTVDVAVFSPPGTVTTNAPQHAGHDGTRTRHNTRQRTGCTPTLARFTHLICPTARQLCNGTPRIQSGRGPARLRAAAVVSNSFALLSFLVSCGARRVAGRYFLFPRSSPADRGRSPTKSPEDYALMSRSASCARRLHLRELVLGPILPWSVTQRCAHNTLLSGAVGRCKATKILT